MTVNEIIWLYYVLTYVIGLLENLYYPVFGHYGFEEKLKQN